MNYNSPIDFQNAHVVLSSPDPVKPVVNVISTTSPVATAVPSSSSSSSSSTDRSFQPVPTFVEVENRCFQDQQLHRHHVIGEFEDHDEYCLSNNKIRGIFEEIDCWMEDDNANPAIQLQLQQDQYQQQKQIKEEQTLQTLFLQSELGVQERAAKMMGDFVAQKMSLFGSEKVRKKITLQDLDDDDHALLQSGQIQLLPERDHNGRLVLFCNMAHLPSWRLEKQKSLLRVVYYVIMTAVQEETVQSQELVWITYNMMKGHDQDQAPIQSTSKVMLMETITRHLRALPIRCTGVHSCSNDPGFLLSQVHIETHAHGRSEREGYHTHQVESPQACAAKLESFGIPARALPISNSVDVVSLGSHNEWLQRQAHKEMNETLETSPFYQQLQKDRMMDLLEPTPIRSSSEISNDHPAVSPAVDPWDEATRAPTTSIGGTRFHHKNSTATSQVLISQQGKLGQSHKSPSAVRGPAMSVVSLSSPPSFSSPGAVDYQPSSLTTIHEGSQRSSHSRYNILGDHKLSAFPFKNGDDANIGTASHQSVHSPLLAPSLTMSDLSGDSCTPRPFDVLFGRGKVKDHPGNIQLHKLIAMHQAKYDSAERWEKTVIAEDIVSSIRQLHGRFLKLVTVHNHQHQPKKQWVEVDPDTAREKVSHTFRSKRTKNVKVAHGSVANKDAPGGLLR